MSYQDLYERAKREDRIADLTPTFHEWKKEGEFIVGEFVHKAEVTSSLGSGTYYQYLFRTDDGLVKFAVGQATDKEVGPSLVPGRVYAVEYRGQVKIAQGRKVNKFKVLEIDTSETAAAESGADEAPF